MNTIQDNNEMFKFLFMKYEKLMINKQELATLLGTSVSTINRNMQEGKNIPSYVKSSAGSKVLFPLVSVADYICNLSTTKIYC